MLRAEGIDTAPDHGALQPPEHKLLWILFGPKARFYDGVIGSALSKRPSCEVVGNPDKPASDLPRFSAPLQGRERGRKHLGCDLLCSVPFPKPPQQIAKDPRILDVIEIGEVLSGHIRAPSCHLVLADPIS